MLAQNGHNIELIGRAGLGRALVEQEKEEEEKEEEEKEKEEHLSSMRRRIDEGT